MREVDYQEHLFLQHLRGVMQSLRASVTAVSEGAAADKGGGVDEVLGRHHCHHERLQQDPTHPLGVALKHI